VRARRRIVEWRGRFERACLGGVGIGENGLGIGWLMLLVRVMMLLEVERLGGEMIPL
jgi:hypothetical protein